MREYCPDVWHVVKFSSPEHGTVFKVLAGWYGGYSCGDSWKLNSGITEIRQDDHFWYFDGYSGSTYKCHKDAEKLSGITAGVYASFEDQLAKLNNGSTVSLIENFKGALE